MLRRVFFIIAMIGSLPQALRAQDEGQSPPDGAVPISAYVLGMNFAITTSPRISVTFHATPNVTVRPGASFSSSTTPLERNGPNGAYTVNDTETLLGLEVDALWSLNRHLEFEPYVGVGLRLLSVSATRSLASGIPPNNFTEEIGSSGSVSPRAVFGVRMPITYRLSVYADMVLEYFTMPTTLTPGFSKWSLETSGIGFILYLI